MGLLAEPYEVAQREARRFHGASPARQSVPVRVADWTQGGLQHADDCGQVRRSAFARPVVAVLPSIRAAYGRVDGRTDRAERRAASARKVVRGVDGPAVYGGQRTLEQGRPSTRRVVVLS